MGAAACTSGVNRAALVSAEAVKTISSGMNDLFDSQRATLLYALVFFTMWLATYLYFWIFDDSFPGKEQK